MGDGEDYEPMNNKQTVLVILLVSILLALPATVACDALGSDGSVAALGSNSDTYTVRPGDTLAGIAARHGTTVQAMVDANADTYPSLATNPGLINVGWGLTIPGGQGNAVVESGGTPSSAPSAAAPAPAPVQFDITAAKREIFRLVNEERVKAALKAWRSQADGRALGSLRAALAVDLAQQTIAAGRGGHPAGIAGELAEEWADLLLSPPKSLTVAEQVEMEQVRELLKKG